MYTKHEFGKQLAEQVNNKYDVTYLANWAHRKYLDHANKLDDETRDAIMIVIAMDEGPEFGYTKDELLELARQLQSNI